MTQAVSPAPPGAGAGEFRLDGYVALVTGAGRGIGAGIAQAFAQAGADLVLVARTAADLSHVASAVRASGRTASVIPADLADVSQAVKIVERAIAERGRLDVLVNNAGGAMPTRYLDTTPEMLDAAFHFNVASPFELTKRATPYLLDSGRGSVVNITSRMDRLAARGMVTYGTVKAAVTQLTRLLAAELAPGVRVNGIAPGVVETDTLSQVLTDELRAQIVTATPLHRLATVADVASTARWLASPAASYVTGKIIEIDGGAEAPVFPHDTPDLQPPNNSDLLVSAQPRRRAGHAGVRYGFRMSAQSAASPESAEPYEVIHLGGEAAAIVPLAELRRLRAVERHASPEALEEAEIEATLAAHDEWVAAGCPGARPHEEVMAELLAGD